MALSHGRAVCSSSSVHWETPEKMFADLSVEFGFFSDPCPLHGSDGLGKEWGKKCFINPPYGRGVADWIQKAADHADRGGTAIMLLPARTDTAWFHEIVLPRAKEIRFLRGRLKFGGAKENAPFPSIVVIFQKDIAKQRPRSRRCQPQCTAPSVPTPLPS